MIPIETARDLLRWIEQQHKRWPLNKPRLFTMQEGVTIGFKPGKMNQSPSEDPSLPTARRGTERLIQFSVRRGQEPSRIRPGSGAGGPKSATYYMELRWRVRSRVYLVAAASGCQTLEKTSRGVARKARLSVLSIHRGCPSLE